MAANQEPQKKSEVGEERSLSGEFSICPSCASQTINLNDGCGICGWTRSQFLEDKSDDEISSRKTRRRKGDGSGCIYWRTVTKKGKDYQEAYYQ
jgi:hypothetical protein